MADIIAHYGGGGKPKPGEHRCATVSYTCSECGKHVSPCAEACRHCGAPFTEREKERRERMVYDL